MPEKHKTKGPPTIIAIRLVEETGDVAYKATITIARGDLAHVGLFEYFDASHITEAIEDALAKLVVLERNPPQVQSMTHAIQPSAPAPEYESAETGDSERKPTELDGEPDDPTVEKLSSDSPPPTNTEAVSSPSVEDAEAESQAQMNLL